jgi:hypothetical protein
MESLLAVISQVDRIRPEISTDRLHPDDVYLFRSIGFPKSFADWFCKVEPMIIESNSWSGLHFKLHGIIHTTGIVCVLARQELGVFVLDLYSRAILFLKADGTCQLVNSGLYQFLYCVGCFLLSAKNTFVDAQDWLTKCKACDPDVFEDENGAWAVLFEEAIAGMF